MVTVARDFHDTIVWIQEGVSIWSPLESGSRRSFLFVTSNRYTQNCAQILYQFQRPKIRRDVCCSGRFPWHRASYRKRNRVPLCDYLPESLFWGHSSTGQDARCFVRSMRGITNSLPCTVWYAPIATSDDDQKCPSCAEVCYDRVSTNLQPFDSKGSKTRPLNLSLTIEQ